MTATASAIGFGEVLHRRSRPLSHAFRYRVFMPFLDLAELDALFARRWFWSVNRRNIASFHRGDFLGDPARPLADAVWAQVEAQLGPQRRGRIMLAANLRYWGYCFNPIAMYFCSDVDGRYVALLADVTNTPWAASRQYVVPLEDGQCRGYEVRKELHVSPFNPMDQQYRWQVRCTAEELYVGITNIEAGEPLAFASIRLALRDASAANLSRALLRFPFMTGRVILAIYWQALRLRLKGLPYIPPPAQTDFLEQKDCSL